MIKNKSQPQIEAGIMILVLLGGLVNRLELVTAPVDGNPLSISKVKAFVNDLSGNS